MKKLLNFEIILNILLIIVLSGCGGNNGSQTPTPLSTPTP